MDALPSRFDSEVARSIVCARTTGFCSVRFTGSKKSNLSLVIKAASDKAVTNVFELHGTKLAVGCLSHEFGNKVENVFACLLGTAIKLGAGEDD